ncbi:gamma-secretase subunit Aph-1b-like isoform X1 [Sardina pilchardus]|uniref:gamma-secretase subunit Aph-1b-like isoform X1 n=1 Tax=Sardina pilchardus TaxID=27697 RepID=UPI002E15EDE3
MTVAVFFGCAFIAFGPAFSLFIFTIAKDPLRVIILIAGAFFWLLSLLLSSLVWFIAVKASNSDDPSLQRGLLIFGGIFSVLLQEVFRYAYYRILRKANEGLAAISEDESSTISVRQMAYVAGLGFGIMSGAFSMINILSDSLGPGTVGIFGDSQYYFITSALMTLAITLLHTFWGVVFFDGCEKSRWWVIGVVVALHLLVSCLSLLNPLYSGSLPPVYAIMVLMAVWAFFSAGGSLASVSQLCSRVGGQDIVLLSSVH